MKSFPYFCGLVILYSGFCFAVDEDLHRANTTLRSSGLRPLAEERPTAQTPSLELFCNDMKKDEKAKNRVADALDGIGIKESDWLWFSDNRGNADLSGKERDVRFRRSEKTGGSIEVDSYRLVLGGEETKGPYAHSTRWMDATLSKDKRTANFSGVVDFKDGKVKMVSVSLHKRTDGVYEMNYSVVTYEPTLKGAIKGALAGALRSRMCLSVVIADPTVTTETGAGLLGDKERVKQVRRDQSR